MGQPCTFMHLLHLNDIFPRVILWVFKTCSLCDHQQANQDRDTRVFRELQNIAANDAVHQDNL